MSSIQPKGLTSDDLERLNAAVDKAKHEQDKGEVDRMTEISMMTDESEIRP